MDFDFSPELQELQATVRKLAQDKVAPRAREIDPTAKYPQDLFELFLDTGLLGLCIPEEYGGSGAGILGLTIAIEEVAKYSNTAALMLLLTRLPTGRVLIAGSEEQKQQYVAPSRPASSAPRSGSRSRRPAATSSACAPRPCATATTGCSPARSAGCRASCRPTGTACSPRPVPPTRASTTTSRASSSSDRLARRLGRPHRRQDGRARRRHRRADPRRRACPGRERRRRGRRLPARDARAQLDAARSSRPAGIGLAEGALMYAVEYVKQRAAFGSTIADMQGIQWKIAELATEIEAGPPAHLPRRDDGRRRQVHEGVRALPLDGEVLRERGRGEGLRRGAADARRGRLHEGSPDRALLPRRHASSRSSRAPRRCSSG